MSRHITQSITSMLIPKDPPPNVTSHNDSTNTNQPIDKVYRYNLTVIDGWVKYHTSFITMQMNKSPHISYFPP